MVDVPNEGQNPFEGKEDDTSSDSPTENNTGDDTQPDQGDDENTDQEGDEGGDDASAGKGTNTDADPYKDVPFHKHPAWKRREKEWQDRFNDQEKRQQDDLKEIRNEFGAAKKANDEDTLIPGWFGGTQEQWDQYREWNGKQISSAEDRALKRLEDNKSAENKAVQEATEFMRSEITFLEGDKTLNPTGTKVDPNKLLKIVMDNDLVDSKGRWNYRAGFRIMQATTVTKPAVPKTGDRKTIAGATTTSNQKGETNPKSFKTTDDFKANKPW